MGLLANSSRVGTSKSPFPNGSRAFALCIPSRVPCFVNHWRSSNWPNTGPGLLVSGPKFSVLMTNMFANTLPNHIFSGEVSISFPLCYALQLSLLFFNFFKLLIVDFNNSLGRHELMLGNTFEPNQNSKPPNKEVPPQVFIPSFNLICWKISGDKPLGDL